MALVTSRRAALAPGVRNRGPRDVDLASAEVAAADGLRRWHPRPEAGPCALRAFGRLAQVARIRA
jgi:hypothetical protein